MNQQHKNEPLGTYIVRGFDDVVSPGEYNVLQSSCDHWWISMDREVFTLLLEHPLSGDLYQRVEVNRGDDSFISFHRLMIGDSVFPDGDRVFACGPSAHKL